MNQLFTHLQVKSLNNKILNMGLPVERIMAEVEEEMLHMDEEVNDELLHVKGEPAEVEHLLYEDDLNEDLAPFFSRPAPIQIFGLRESKPSSPESKPF